MPRYPIRELRRIVREGERAVVVLGLTSRLRRTSQPDECIDALVTFPQRLCRLQGPGHVLRVGVERGWDTGHSERIRTTPTLTSCAADTRCRRPSRRPRPRR